MELRSFITQTLTDIMGGVMDAQKNLPEGSIVPGVSSSFKSVETGISPLQGIDFQVEVRAESTQGSEAKLNVFTAVVGGGVKGESGEEAGHTATLKFKVPIRFPESPKG